MMTTRDNKIVDAWNKRDTTKPDSESILRIANAFNVDVSYVKCLLDEEE